MEIKIRTKYVGNSSPEKHLGAASTTGKSRNSKHYTTTSVGKMIP
jgi:hypothetical protein